MIDAIIQRLDSDACPIIKTARGAVGLAEIMDAQFSVPLHQRPAAFVMLAGEQPGTNTRATQGVDQVNLEHVAIALCVGAGDQGAKEVAKDAVKAVRDGVMDALLGWSPEADLGCLEYGGLAMLALKPRAVWFQMLFTRRIGVSSG